MILPRKLNPCDLVNNTLPRYAEGNRRESNPEAEVTRRQAIVCGCLKYLNLD